MIVGDLLQVPDLPLGLAWGPPELLEREVTGVTSTDLQDPARYLQPGELVLSGLVWWQPDHPGARALALRFATSLRSAGVAALLAGEGTHGEVPPSLVEACRVHGIPLLSVPAGVSFRAVTDRIYLRLWGDLRSAAAGTAAVPEGARRELVELMYSGAPAAVVLDRAVSRLGCGPCSLVAASGRTIATSADAPDPDPETVRRALENGVALPIGEGGDTPFDGWYLYPHAAEPGQAAVLHGLADVLATLWTRTRGEAAERRRAAGRLAALLTGAAPVHSTELAEALASCELPPDAPLVPLTARIDGVDLAWAADALAEALRSASADAFAVGADENGRAVAVAACDDPVRLTEGLREVWHRLQARLPDRHLLRAGVGPRAVRPTVELVAGLRQARYALDAAAVAAPRGATVGTSTELDSLAALVRGIPPEVADAFRRRLLDPLTEHDRIAGGALLATLVAFLDHDCSWARTAAALHVHVNTVHYRVRRIEELTERDLGRLDDRLDLRAALLCGVD
ncbi:PucR family transcriptional regulator [Kitasatospora azatica]|uniref:PucR family transcriptional regulator n=1 Tax=Kitasatospora azatica TaxID=58347 RepID=UPI0005673858|nr:PucR family transcriptional regulator [Kitasatospora azatica]